MLSLFILHLHLPLMAYVNKGNPMAVPLFPASLLVPSTCAQLIGLVFIFIYALFGLQFFADRAQVPQQIRTHSHPTQHFCR